MTKYQRIKFRKTYRDEYIFNNMKEIHLPDLRYKCKSIVILYDISRLYGLTLNYLICNVVIP